LGRERHGKGGYPENGDYGKYAEKRFGALHGMYPLGVVNRARSFVP
jgi:hypothetical protein